MDAGPATEAPLHGNNRAILIQGYRRLFARFQACAALTTGFFTHFRLEGPYKAHVHNLRAGTGVRAIGNGDSELVVEFQRATHLFFKEALQISPGEHLFNFLH